MIDNGIEPVIIKELGITFKVYCPKECPVKDWVNSEKDKCIKVMCREHYPKGWKK